MTCETWMDNRLVYGDPHGDPYDCYGCEVVGNVILNVAKWVCITAPSYPVT